MTTAKKLAEEYATHKVDELGASYYYRIGPGEWEVDMRTAYEAGFAACVEAAKKKRHEHLTNVRWVGHAVEYVKDDCGCVSIDDLEALLKDGVK